MKYDRSITYSLIFSGPRMVCDVPNYILAPYEWMIVIRLELAGNEIHPCIERLEPLLTEHVCEVVLDCEYCRSPNMVANDTE